LLQTILRNIAFVLLAIVLGTCTKENFVEPQDPFEVQRLEPNPTEIQLGSGKNALVIKTNKSNIVETENGIRVKGSIYAQNETYGDVRVSTGDFELVFNEVEGFYEQIQGIGMVDLPNQGLLSELKIDKFIYSPIGFKKGSEFEDIGIFGWPVNPDRYYFYYETPDRFNLGITKTALDAISKVAVDPQDPYFFMACSFSGSPFGPTDNAKIAFSTQGLIPYEPLVTFYDIPSFTGHIYLGANIPLLEFPASVEGEYVLRFADETGDAAKFFNGEDFNFRMGTNGKVTFDHEALDWLNIEVVLGEASTYLQLDPSGESMMKWAGQRSTPSTTPSDFVAQVIGQDWDFLDYLQISEQKETFYGTIGTVPSDWEFGFKTESSMKIGNYSIDMGGIELELSPVRMYFKGTARLAGFTRASLSGEINKNGNFELKGSVSNGFHAEAAGLSIGYDLGLDITFKHKDGTVTFKAKAHLSGEACLGKLCAGFSINASITISSNGDFEVCFSIGIGKLGFDVCIDFNTMENIDGTPGYKQTMTAIEIPLEQVPIENRFPAK